ncbi:MAG: threonine--tRNA ligase [Acidimicrobiales bacterium]
MAPEIEVTLPDGSARRLPDGATAADLAASIGRRLARAAVAATVDGAQVDLGVPLADGASVAILTDTSDEGRAVLRHSTAHVLAQAVCDLFPGTRYAIGPPIRDGFYYDFELPDGARFTDDDLVRIEARMREIVGEDQAFVREELSKDEGLARFVDQPYKVEIIEGVDPSEGAGGGVVSTYRNEGWLDLCRGPHVPSTSRLGAFKLTRVAGAYWRGDARNQMLQRIYGTAWESDAALADHLSRLEEAERRDHRRLGAELDLFSFPEELGPGLSVWHPHGAVVRRVMEEYSRAQHEASGYQFVYSPHLARSTLWETSGHLGFYADAMYPPMELEDARYYPKPMNCPFHLLVYRSSTRSYRDLPMRLFELGTVYRFERSGVLHGLLRARGFTQDDSHIFCTPDQIVPELTSLLDFVVRMLRTFGFETFTAEVSTRPVEKSVGSDEEWALATDALFEAIKASGLPHTVAEGEGAFYGPKIDIHVLDAIGRPWQLSTLQVDFQMGKRFGLTYVGADNARHPPIMIHRALFGSVERFFGILVEHYAGAFPAWLAPVQARVLGVRSDHDEYVATVVGRLREAGFRADSVPGDEALGTRIRRAKLEKLPYVLVVGDSDAAAGTVGVNPRGGEVERDIPVDEFVDRLAAEVASRS